ncbi:hypothetical protein N7495_007599 [Penicillium taxi]|uniref:uncharacterized protein n=1 Tax=Penicillium taxi TaxID=168475 RepID=UPI002545009B|nr:uncharacterized protein N7495_007599 [Penicillium taxi]KAJ5887558.1 hypothetical protein N7495_007599 [Penicillium taxi]
MERSNTTNIGEIFLLYSSHCLLPATLLITTSKRSALRYLYIPCSIWILHRAIQLASALGPGFIWCEFARLFVTVFFQALNILFFNPRDGSDIPSSGGRVLSLYYVAKILTQPRGINTSWESKNAPSQPTYYGERTPSKTRFLIRQVAISTWQYLALDLFSTLAVEQAKLKQINHESMPLNIQWYLPVDQWIERIVSNIVAGFVVSRILIDFHHRAFSVFTVGLGFESPSDSPPLFGRAVDAYTLRGFWGKFWHQLIRQPLTSMSVFITRVIGLPRGSLLNRYSNVIIIFMLSGLMHIAIDTVQGIPSQESGAFLFFTSAPMGIMIEDGITGLWKSLCPRVETKSTQQSVHLWQRALGFCWVGAWLGITSTLYLYPQMRRPENSALVPFSFAEYVGLPLGGFAGFVGIIGLVVAWLLKAEI